MDDEAARQIALCLREFLSPYDVNLVTRAALEQSDRLCAYLNAEKRVRSPEELASFMLRCAKRVLAGGEA